MQKIPALTGLRFFAAAAIVLWHSQTGYFFKPEAFRPFYAAGAVALFFVLSGFVLTIGSDKYRSWSDFFVARIARVWPAHLAALAFWAFIFLPGSLKIFLHLEMVGRLILNASLLQAWIPDAATYWSYNSPSWSISCEMFFYAVFPVCVSFLSRTTWTRVAALAVALGGAVYVIGSTMPWLDSGWLGAMNPLSGLTAFAIGIAAAVVWKRLPPTKNAGVPSTILQLVALAAALSANALFPTHEPHGAPAAFQDYLVSFGAAPFYAALIFALARYDGLVSRFLSLPLVVYGGEISYSLYLFHQLIFRFHSLHRGLIWFIPNWIQYAGIWAISLTLAALCYARIERPWRAKIMAEWNRRSELTSTVTS